MVDPDSPEGLGAAAAPNHAVDRDSIRGQLDRRTVLQAAVTLVDRDGLRDLTMRRVGEQLGVSGIAIYRYVHGRDDLLNGVAELIIDDLFGDPEVHLVGDNWQDFLVRLAHGVRRIALAHPQVFPLVATRPPAAPWIRPPLRSLRWMETFLSSLRGYGFSDHAAVTAYRAFSSFLIGRLLLEVADLGAEISPIEQPNPDEHIPPDLSDFPLLVQLRPELSRDSAAADFEETLETVLDRLERLALRPARLAPPAPRPTSHLEVPT